MSNVSRGGPRSQDINRLKAIALNTIVHTVNDSPHWVFTSNEFDQFIEAVIIESTSIALSNRSAEYYAGWTEYCRILDTHLRGT